MTVIWWALVCYMAALPFILIGVGEYLLALSFYINGCLIAYMARQSIVRNIAGPAFATVNVFFLLFFYVAPMYQIVEYPGHLINNYSAPLGQMVLANIFIFLFMATFLFFYMKRIRAVHTPLLKVDDRKIDSVFPLFVALAVAMAVWALSVMLTTSVELDDDTVAVGNIAITLRQKVAFAIPFTVLGFYLSRKRGNRSLILVGFLILLVLLSKNIMLDRRNALGPVYMALLFLLMWRGEITSRSVFLLVGFGLLFVFPVAAIFINNPIQSWGDLLNYESVTREISDHFVNMHYDAWANLVAVIQYVETEGLQLGRQLLGTVLAFFPREFWADKPVATGQLLGDYLVLNHGLWFTNISSPFPAEGYIDFGLVGIIVYALGLAFYSQRMDFFVNRGGAVDRTSALYFAFFLTFVMRGSLLPAVAFGAGSYIAMNVLPALLSRVGLKSRYVRGNAALTVSGNSAIGRR